MNDQHRGTVTVIIHDPDDVPKDIIIRIEDIPELVRRLREVYLKEFTIHDLPILL